MRHSGLSALIAVGLLITLSSGAPAQPKPSPSPSPVAKFTPYPYVDQFGCYFAGDHEQADLCAQWQAARAAQQSADSMATANLVAAIALFVSAVGMFGLFGTLYQTNMSLIEARKATKAAEEAVVETQRIGEAQVRCYLVVKNVCLRINSKTKKPALQVTIENVGQSPAREVKRKIILSYSRQGDLDKKRSLEVNSFKDASIYLAPNTDHVLPRISYTFPLNDDENKLASAKKLSVVVQILLAATDVFGKPVRIATTYAKLSVGYDQDVILDHIAHIDKS